MSQLFIITGLDIEYKEFYIGQKIMRIMRRMFHFSSISFLSIQLNFRLCIS